MKSIKRFLMVAALAVGVVFSSGCTRITDGEVGVRKTFGGEYEQTELLTGWHQTMVGDVLTFPVRDLAVSVQDMKPLTSEKTALADLDVNVIYSVNPSSVAELYTRKSRSLHTVRDNQVLLMDDYMKTVINAASNKVIVKYKSLEVNDNREAIEADIKETVVEKLKEDKVDDALKISMVQIKGMAPNAQILQSATDLVRAQNDYRIKETEIKTARAEAERMQALAVNSQQSIAYLEAQSKMKIAEAIAAGKVQTIIVPSNMTSLMISGK